MVCPFLAMDGVTRRVCVRLEACPSLWSRRTRQAWRPRRPSGVGCSIDPFALGAKRLRPLCGHTPQTPHLCVASPTDSVDSCNYWTRHAAPPGPLCVFHAMFPGCSEREAFCYRLVCTMS